MAVIAKLHLGGGVHFAVTARAGGVSATPYESLNLGDHVGDEPAAVAENRLRLAREIGIQPDRLMTMAQVHGSDVAFVPAAPPAVTGLTDSAATASADARPDVLMPPVGRVDAITSDAPDVALLALGADCAPVMLADPQQGLIAVAHCGRLGLLSGVIAAAVQQLRSFGAQSLVARVGPAICGRCYEVPTTVRDEVAAVVPEALARTQWGTPGLDVGLAALAQLERLDVDAARLGGCTYEDSRYFSHRRDGTTGRHAGVVWRVSDQADRAPPQRRQGVIDAHRATSAR